MQPAEALVARRFSGRARLFDLATFPNPLLNQEGSSSELHRGLGRSTSCISGETGTASAVMAKGEQDKDQAEMTTQGHGQPTTPYGTPEPPEKSRELRGEDAFAAGLRQRYDILEELGRGGMGIVYKARDCETDALVALKVLRAEIARDAAAVERFKSELLLARKITHKNVCRIYELLRFGDAVVISMEFVEGEGLRAILNRFKGVPLRRGLEWAITICDALSEAHSQGVVHRDLKPENVVITRDGDLKVMDFGIARSIETQTATTGVIVGTPAYMSPEQAEGKPADARSDIYSLGLVLYEMFTGRQAFEADTPVAFALKQIHESPPFPRDLDPYMPAFLNRAIQKCLEKNPKDRFQSIEELGTALSGEAPTEAVPEREPRPRDELRVWRRRDWILLALGLIGVVCFLNRRDAVLPGSRMRLETDALTAQNKTAEVIQRLGRRLPPEKLEARDELGGVREHMAWRLGTRRSAEFLLPIYWRVSRSDIEVLLDSTGKLVKFSYPFWIVPWNYQPPPVEQRREIAQKAVEAACGPLPAGLTVVETTGGDMGAEYSAKWRRGPDPWATAERDVSLVAEKVTAVRCARVPSGHPSVLREGALQNLAWAVLLFTLAAALLYFGMDQSYRLPILRKRIPVALLLGFSGVWLLTPAFFGSEPSLFFLLGAAVEASAICLVAFVAVENRLSRIAPGWVGTYTIALRGRILEPGIGLAVFRGALAGLALIGLETLTACGSTVPMFTSAEEISSQTLKALFVDSLRFWLDPTPVGDAIVSFSPALFVVLSSVFHGFIIGFFVPGIIITVEHKQFLKSHRASAGLSSRLWARLILSLGITLALSAFVYGLRLHFAASLGEGLSDSLEPLLLGAFMGWVALSYDLLTSVATVSTYILWTLSYHLLGILEVIGNGPYVGIFGAWGGLVLAGAVVGFSPKLLSSWRRLRADVP